jgi:hypothetical protein
LKDLTVATPDQGVALKSYSAGELRLLAAEGRLKGRGIDQLVNLRGTTDTDRAITDTAYFALAAKMPCWTDPLDLVHTFLALAKTPSPSGEEDAIATMIRPRLGELGFSIEADAMGNLLGHLPATSETAPNLLFTAHMDCVYPGGSAPVTPVFHRSGHIGTDGQNSLGADDKSGIAAILATLRYLVHGGVPHGDIQVVFTVQEERGWRGIKHIPARILNGIHLVLSMDPPVRVERNETGFMAVLHAYEGHPLTDLVRSAARDVGSEPLILYSEDGYVGGDTICLSPLGALVVDFCSGSRYAHTTHEHLRLDDLTRQTSWMIATAERFLRIDRNELELRSVYGNEPIGNLTGVRKQIPLTPDFLAERIAQARSLHTLPGPSLANTLSHLSAMVPRAGDPLLLDAVVAAYARGMRVDQVPQVQRALTSALTHLGTNLADVRPLESLIPVARDFIEGGGDDNARSNAIRFLEELFVKERRVRVKEELVRSMIVMLQAASPTVVESVRAFFRSHLDDTIHALTLAFCNRNRAGWERQATVQGRVVDGRKRRTDASSWTLIRQRILQLLLEEDRLLPEMLDWIFTHDGGATQRIAVDFIDPGKATRIADRILRNLKRREPGVQETALHFVGTHRMAQAIDPLIDLLLTPHLCRNRSLVEWSLDSIGRPALNPVINRLGSDTEYEALVRRMFNRHDTSTDTDFDSLLERLSDQYGGAFSPSDPAQVSILSSYLNIDSFNHLADLTRWDKRRSIVFYDRMMGLYSTGEEVDRLVGMIEECDAGSRPYFLRMAVQKNLFEDPGLLALLSHENARFLENFVRLENQIPQHIILGRLREFGGGAQLDMRDPNDVEIYYLYLLQQSPRMPDRTQYLSHIAEAARHLFPPLRPYCKAFSISGDRIEEVGTVDRDRIRTLIDGLPNKSTRASRLRHLIFESGVAKRERNRLINGLSDAMGIDVSTHSSLEDRADALLEHIDFEFDSAYRIVPLVIYPILIRIRMNHRSDEVLEPLAWYALEYAMINHPEISESFDTGEIDLTLDGLNDLLTDRVYEAERELSEDVFPELLDRHKDTLGKFHTAQWRSIVKRLSAYVGEGRQRDLFDTTIETMEEYDITDDEAAALLDTNLARLVAVVRPNDRDLLTTHARHREFHQVYDAVLRVRNLRQLKRIYKEVYLILQDTISFASREHPTKEKPSTRLQTGDEVEENGRSRYATDKGYLKYARKELGKLTKLMGDFVLERALSDRLQTVQSEITKLRQVVVGTHQILCVPSKDVSIIYRSWPGNDCNTGDIKQILCPDGSFFKIIADGHWKGYFTLVELRRRNERAFLLDVLNFSGLRMDNESFVKVLMHQVIQTAQKEGVDYVLTSPSEVHLSNRDYIRRAFRKVFPILGTEQSFGLINEPRAHFQSLQPNLAVAWRRQHR